MSNSQSNGKKSAGFGSFRRSTLFISMTHHTKREPLSSPMKAVTPRFEK